jgi:fructosamine-3-kinase
MISAVKKLKGGSLSSTYYIKSYDQEYISKEIVRDQNREYGFVRWYSQLKKLQRYNTLYPNLFPQVIDVGVDHNKAFFKMEYMKGFRDIKTILTNDTLTDEQIFRMSQAVWKGLNQLHSVTHDPIPGAGNLYFEEEVLQKMTDALAVAEFAEFYAHGTYEYDGRIVQGIGASIHDLENFFSELKLIQEENIHGNPTLENILYSFEEDRVVFIDVYDESMIDSRFLDYAQVLQCSRSHYGFINDNKVDIGSISVTHRLQIPKNFETFNYHFESGITEPRTKEIVDVFEATQFIRMLPFKVLAGDIDKAKFFYVHACYLLSKVFR